MWKDFGVCLQLLLSQDHSGALAGRLLVPGVSFDSAAPPLFTPVAPSDCNESLTCTHRDAAVEAGWHQLYK